MTSAPSWLNWVGLARAFCFQQGPKMSAQPIKPGAFGPAQQQGYRCARLQWPIEAQQRGFRKPKAISHYYIQGCPEPGMLDKGSFALGKGFVESGSQQRPVGTSFFGKEVFAESYSWGSRQRVCQEPTLALGKEKLLLRPLAD